ncbi:MAG: S8 family peptidase [Bacteroidales bacterium]|nr:S8 family peptidase [Bacteroidales bacterium]
MKKYIISALLFAMVSVVAFGSQRRMSAATKLWVAQHGVLTAQQVSLPQVEAFVSVDSPSVLQALEDAGVRVNASFDGFSTVTIPAGKLLSVTDIPGVKLVDVAHRVRLLTDSVASSTGAKWVNEGVGLPQSFTGRGVIMGIIDSGVDFNHRAFLDADLQSRVQRVYMPHSAEGQPVDGLPGSEFVGDEIAKLRYDTNVSHGTHTTGIAAGSIVGQYRGMAPDADLVLCALGDSLTDVNVVHSVNYLARYAATVGKPCVISMSLGNHDGPHDGNGFMARAFAEIAQRYPQVMIVLAAGNEGNVNLYLGRNVTPDAPLATILSSSLADVDAWSDSAKPFAMRLLVVDSNNNAIVYTSDCLKSDTTFSLSNNEALSRIASAGKVAVTFGANDVTGHTHIYVASDMRMLTGYKLALQYVADEEVNLHVWECTGSSALMAYGMEGFSQGSSECSISDMATGQGTISVGSYVNRNRHTDYRGGTVRDSSAPIGSISSFSSYGRDMNGVAHPFITAPGSAVISALNSYLARPSTCAMVVANAEGRECNWGVMSGTSMATPCVAGIVALWLEANPALTISQVKEVMASSANKTGDTDDIRWGHGKVNAYEGIVQVLSSKVDDLGIASRAIHMVDCGDVVSLVSSEACPIAASVYSVGGVLVKQVSGIGRLDIDLSHLSKGVYLIKATASHASRSFKFLKR